MIKNFKIIDAHCHIYPDKIAAAAVGATDRFYGVVSAFDGSVSALINQCDQMGVDMAVVQSVATTAKQVSSINRFIAENVKKYSDRLIGLGTLYPDSDMIEENVEEIVSLGLLGVKLHPDIQKFKIDDYRCLKIYELCEKKGLPILMHTGDYRYDYSNPNRLRPILETYTNLTVIGAHLGGWSVWEEAAEKLASFENFYVDTSSCLSFGGEERIKEAIKKYSPDKILFATDYPMGSQKTELDFLFSLGYSDSELEKILYKNALKVFLKK